MVIATRKRIKIAIDTSNQMNLQKFNTFFQNIKKMRHKFDAPVDNYGAQKLYDPSADVKLQRFHILLSLMLSSQTKDQITAQVMNKIRDQNISCRDILSMDVAQIEKLIYPAGFYKTKAKHIHDTVKILTEYYNDDIPNTLEQLLKLPGVGPKMAILAMQIAWNNTVGISVDTHVHRISNRLGLVNTKTPEATRKSLEAWVPKEHWKNVNKLLVGFGQQICLPLSPKCQNCLNSEICPSAKLF